MKKIIFATIITLMIAGTGSVMAAEKEVTDVNVYVDDVLNPSYKMYTDDEFYLFSDETVPYFVPLEETVKLVGDEFEYADNNKAYINANNEGAEFADVRSSVFMEFGNDMLIYNWFRFEKPDSSEEIKSGGGVHYRKINGVDYVDLGARWLDFEVIREDNNIYIYSNDYYNEHYCKFKSRIQHAIGKHRNDILYINDKETDIPIYTNSMRGISHNQAGGASYNDYIPIRPFVEAFNAEINFEMPNKIIIKKEDGSETEIKAIRSYISEGNYPQRYDDYTEHSDCYIVDGVTYMPIEFIASKMGCFSRDNQTEVNVYYRDYYIREKIPATLNEVYEYLDNTLSDEDIEYIKNNDTAALHFGLGLWMRNTWIYPLGDSSDLKFINEIPKEYQTHADNISSYVLTRYQEYLLNK